MGEQDPRIEPTRKLVQNLKEKGLKVEFASFPGGHEWQVWRKSIHDFAQGCLSKQINRYKTRNSSDLICPGCHTHGCNIGNGTAGVLI